MEKYSEAEAAYKRAISLDEKFADPWYRLGNLYQYRVEKYSKAEESYKKAIKLDNNFVSPWVGLGDLYQYHYGRYLEAEHAYKKVMSLNKKFAYSWYALGNLYQHYLGRYSEAETAYKKAISMNEKSVLLWNRLGNLYQDHLQKYAEAEVAYKEASKIDPTNCYPKFNMVFLLRDKMNKLGEAKDLFSSIKIEDELKDSYHLNEALFEFYDTNIGAAKDFLEKAIEAIKEEELPDSTEGDWYRSAAIIVKLGYGETLLKVLADNNWNTLMRPFYIAIEALTNKEEELFLNSIAAEVREPAKIIMQRMKNYIK